MHVMVNMLHEVTPDRVKGYGSTLACPMAYNDRLSHPDPNGIITIINSVIFCPPTANHDYPN